MLFDPTDPETCHVTMSVMPPRILGGDPDAVIAIIVSRPGVEVEGRWKVELQVRPDVWAADPAGVLDEATARVARLAEGEAHEDHWGERLDDEYRHEGWQAVLYVDEGGLVDLELHEVAAL